MADLISPDRDGFQRYTFTYKEHNWDEKHNENWTQTVSQLYEIHNQVDDNVTDLGQLAQDLDLLQGKLDELDSDSGKFIDFGDYGDDLDTQKIARLTSTAAVDAETLNITVLRADLKAGDEIIAYDLGAEADIANRVHLTVAQDTDQGANTLVVEPLGEELKEGTILLPDPAFVVAQLRLLGGDQAQFSSKIARVEDELNAAKSSITQTADEIALAVQRISETEGLIAQQETAIRQTAEKIELFAVETIEDEVLDKIEHAESRIDINAQEIRLLNQRTTDHNGRLRQQASQIKINKDQISLASGQIDTFENIIEGVRSEIKVENDRITSLVTDFEQIGDDVAFNASQITQLSDEIESIVVEQETNENTLLGAITNDLDAGEEVTTLNLDNTLDVELKEDDVLILEATGEDRLASDPLYIRVTVRQDVEKNANSVPIFKKYISNCPPGSPLHLPITTAMSRITQTADAIELRVDNVEESLSGKVDITEDSVFIGVEDGGDPDNPTATFIDVQGNEQNIKLKAERVEIEGLLDVEDLAAVSTELGSVTVTELISVEERLHLAAGGSVSGDAGWSINNKGFGVVAHELLQPKTPSAIYSIYDTDDNLVGGVLGDTVGGSSFFSEVTVQAILDPSQLHLESRHGRILYDASEQHTFESGGLRFANALDVSPDANGHIVDVPVRSYIRYRVQGSGNVDLKRFRSSAAAPEGTTVIIQAGPNVTLRIFDRSIEESNNIRLPTDPNNTGGAPLTTRTAIFMIADGLGSWRAVGFA